MNERARVEKYITYTSINMAGNRSFQLDSVKSLEEARDIFRDFCDGVMNDDCHMTVYTYSVEGWASALEFKEVGCPFDYPEYIIERGPMGGVITQKA